MQVYRLGDLSVDEKHAILQRSGVEFRAVIPKVQEIMEDVRLNGDDALRRWTERYDQVKLSGVAVRAEEFVEAYNQVDISLITALEQAIQNLEIFHRTQLIEEEMVEVADGIRVGRMNRAIEKVGFYIPGGYPSTVVMTGVPSRLAGCQDRTICTPPENDGSVPASILVAADLVGIRKVFKVGGVQAIAAMTYGTETVPKVYKIFGAGRLEVTVAKMLAFAEGAVSIDLPAGPTEIFIIADETANPAFVAADLLSQAEHGPNSACVLITTSESLAAAVDREVDRQLVDLPTRGAAAEAIDNYGVILIADDPKACIDFINEYAPEHLEVMTSDDQSVLQEITHTGSVFLGPYSTEPAGDYASGSNHVLPTSGYAKMFSPLSVDAFIRKVQVQELTREGLAVIRSTVGALADVEGFVAHKRAVEIRFSK